MAIGNTVKDGTGTPYWQVVNDAGYIRTYDWEPEIQSDVALNDSDKTLTVPAGEEWIVRWIWLEFTVGAGANRQIEIQIQDDAAAVIDEIRAGAVQAAASTRYYHFSPHSVNLGAFYDTDWLMTPIPEWILSPLHVIRIWDNAAVLPVADDLLIRIGIGKRSTT